MTPSILVTRLLIYTPQVSAKVFVIIGALYQRPIILPCYSPAAKFIEGLVELARSESALSVDQG